MKKLISVSAKLKYIGLLGLPILFSDLPIWKYLWLFWLFGLVEIVFDLPVLVQSLKQLIAIPYIHFKYRFQLPSVQNYSSVLYSLPFAEGWTVVNGSVEKGMSHSWAIVPQRYAYDFVVLDKSGNSCAGDTKKPESYHCYGKNVLAPADGVVILAVDQHPDSEVDGKGTVFCGAKDIRGNHVLIQHAPREYSLIAHLKPGSLLVHPGQTVTRGQVLAQCGNSGNTSEPHIHFQVQSGKSFFFSAGLPVSFQSIQVRDAEQYQRFDPRPILPQRVAAEETRQFICRGKSVSNQ